MWRLKILPLGFVQTFLFAIVISCIPVKAHAATYDPLKIYLIGFETATAPMYLTPNDIGHGWEVEGFSYMGTDLLYRFMPKGVLRNLAPVFMGVLDFAYRSSELGHGNDGAVFQKMGLDVNGILARIAVTF